MRPPSECNRKLVAPPFPGTLVASAWQDPLRVAFEFMSSGSTPSSPLAVGRRPSRKRLSQPPRGAAGYDPPQRSPELGRASSGDCQRSDLPQAARP